MHPTYMALHEVTWYGASLYGVHRTHRDGSSFEWHQVLSNLGHFIPVYAKVHPWANVLAFFLEYFGIKVDGRSRTGRWGKSYHEVNTLSRSDRSSEDSVRLLSSEYMFTKYVCRWTNLRVYCQDVTEWIHPWPTPVRKQISEYGAWLCHITHLHASFNTSKCACLHNI